VLRTVKTADKFAVFIERLKARNILASEMPRPLTFRLGAAKPLVGLWSPAGRNVIWCAQQLCRHLAPHKNYCALDLASTLPQLSIDF